MSAVSYRALHRWSSIVRALYRPLHRAALGRIQVQLSSRVSVFEWSIKEEEEEEEDEYLSRSISLGISNVRSNRCFCPRNAQATASSRSQRARHRICTLSCALHAQCTVLESVCCAPSHIVFAACSEHDRACVKWRTYPTLLLRLRRQQKCRWRGVHHRATLWRAKRRVRCPWAPCTAIDTGVDTARGQTQRPELISSNYNKH